MSEFGTYWSQKVVKLLEFMTDGSDSMTHEQMGHQCAVQSGHVGSTLKQ